MPARGPYKLTRLKMARNFISDMLERIRARAPDQDPKGLPTMTENEERAYRQALATYRELWKELAANSGKTAPQITINLDQISTDELKARLGK